MTAEDRELIKAKESSFRLLNYRQRSVEELKGRLKKKGFSGNVVQKTIAYLSDAGYLNDRDFARFWIADRIKARPQGLALLRYQLRQKGVSAEIIETALSEDAADYDEYAAAQRLAASRRRRYRGLERAKVKKRLYDYLQRKGFAPEVILQAIE